MHRIKKTRIEIERLRSRHHRRLRRLGFGPRQCPDYHFPASVLLASLEVGPVADRIASYLGQPRRRVRELSRRARSQGLWRGGKIAVEWDDPEPGGIAFACDVLVLSGMLDRSSK